MGLIERRNSPGRVRNRERGFEVQLGELGGFELRPTRVFVWTGVERRERERILSLGRAPRNLLIPRKESEYRAGAVRVRAVGNPLMTVALAAIQAARTVKRTLDEDEGAKKRVSAGRD
jgi:hypothetical protein